MVDTEDTPLSRYTRGLIEGIAPRTRECGFDGVIVIADDNFAMQFATGLTKADMLGALETAAEQMRLEVESEGTANASH